MDQARLQQAVLEQMPHALVVWHLSGSAPRTLSLVAANAAASRLSGFDLLRWLGRALEEVCPQAAAQGRSAAYAAVLQGGVQRPLEPGTYPELAAVPVSGVLLPIGAQHVAVLFDAATAPGDDERERKLAIEALERAQEELALRVAERTSALQAAEEQLRQAQKMEAVGRLAGGVAHDFNNLLSVILSYTTILADGLEEHDPIADGLSQIRKASERAAALTRQLLAFSRQQVLAPRVVDLNMVLDQMSHMLRRVIGEDVELKILQAPALGRIRADPGQLEQVVMNLVVNARDAMPGGGRLTLKTQNVDLDEAYAREHVGVSPGPYVMFSVADTGTGMDQDTLGRVFEPFFTTKKLGKGTGLGLSTVFGIVKQSGGHISAESTPTQGSIFRIYFARTEDPLSSATPQEGTAQARGGSETLLLVEDEEQVRRVARDILLALGYRVLDAGSPSEALALSSSHAGSIDLLLTDVVMPEMNGRALADRLRLQRPDLEVLYMSGYADKALDPDGVLAPGAAFLQKPITPASLTSAVRCLLDERRLGHSRSA